MYHQSYSNRFYLNKIDNDLSLNPNVSYIQIFQIFWALIFVIEIFKKFIYCTPKENK